MGVRWRLNEWLEGMCIRGWIIAFALGVLLGVDIAFARRLNRRYALLQY